MPDALPSAAASFRRGLTVLAHSNGFTLWHYRSCRRLAEIREPGHFIEHVDRLADGDLIIVSASDQSAILVVRPSVDTAVLL